MSFGGEGSQPVSAAAVPGFKAFVSQDEIEEKKRQRQEEWDKVRKPDDPLEAPEEEVDNRCLFDKLQEQKQKKQDEYEDQFKMRNQVQGLGKDEAEFLDFVSQRQTEVERERNSENEAVLQEYREAVFSHSRESETSGKGVKRSSRPQLPSTKTKSQQALLAGVVKRKSSSSEATSEVEAKKQKTSVSGEASQVSKAESDNSESDPDAPQSDPSRQQVARVIAVLPGLGAYTDSSDSNSSSSDSEPEIGASNGKCAKHDHSHSCHHH